MVKKLQNLYIYLVLVFLYAPILVLAVYSFNASKSNRVWGGFSLKWYVALFSDREIMSALYYTLMCAIAATVVSTIIGTISAIGMHALNDFPRIKAFALNINYLPVINPDIVTGISLMLVFSFASARMGFVTMLISHITFCVPYVVLSVLPKLNQMDKHLIEAAMDLGASPMFALRKIVLPEIYSGIVTGALLAFTLSIDDFVISFFNTGSGVSNLSIFIYSAARRGISPEVNALSTLMVLCVSILLVVANLRSGKEIASK
ncbi:MAG: ABC transporter permease [Eubacteriaceae bacterium]|nr:ABC transporter permease [Eubacteriaceae bacterium]